MCIVGGGNGLTFIMIGAPVIFLFSWLLRQRGGSAYFKDQYDDFYRDQNRRNHSMFSVDAWTCLNPRCKHRNMAGANYCGRCGATRGYTYRVDEDDDD